MIYYSDYLELDRVLDSQHPESDKHGAHAHDELLFIITHQTFELWFKQVLFELKTVIDDLDRDYVPEASVATCHARLQRVNRIMEHAANQFTILETMTPPDFMDFRAFLNPASGFQSVQWRVLERTLGLSDDRRVLRSYRDSLTQEHRAAIEAATNGPTLFSVVQQWLEKMPFMESGSYTFWEEYRTAVRSMLDNDRVEIRRLAEAEGHDPSEALAQVDANEKGFLAIFDTTQYDALVAQGSRRLSQRATLAVLFISTYREYPLLQIPYRFLDAVIELDRLVSLWRYRHTMMVSRMIGMRVGTGGSSGHDYLMMTTLKQRVFDDITAMSSFLIPRTHTPALPGDLAERLQFVNETRV